MNPINLAREKSLYKTGADRALSVQQRDLARLQEQIATGRRVNRASDDAPAFVQARRLEALGTRFEQYQRSIDAAQPWVDHTQDALDELAERFAEIYERGVRATSPVYNAGSRAAEADRIEAMLEDLVGALNVQENGEYLFAGTRTDAPPFALGGGAVVYNGNSESRSRQIGDGVRVEINVSGDRLLDTGAGFTITGAVQDLADALRTGDPAQMQTALERVGTAREHVTEVGAEAGGVARQLDLAAEQLRTATLRTEARRSQLEDTDLAAALVAMQEAQTGLQAALKVTATVRQTTLLDYLRL